MVKWKKFENKVIEPLDGLDCDDTTHGTCLKVRSIEDCIKYTEGLETDLGYYVDFLYSNKDSICVPLENYMFYDASVADRLRSVNKSSLNGIKLSDVKITTFINTDEHEFPSIDGNSVYYSDIFTIAVDQENLTEKITGKINSDEQLYISTKINSLVGEGPVIISNEESLISVDAQDRFKQHEYRHIKYGEKIMFRVPSTALKMVKDQNSGDLKWTSSIGEIRGNPETFMILPYNSDKKLWDPINYGEKVYFSYLGTDKIGISPECNCLTVGTGTKPTIFTLKSKMPSYACINNKCVKVDDKDVIRSGFNTKHKNGTDVYRHPECFFLCNGDQSENDIDVQLVVFTGLFIIIILVLVITVYS